MADQEINAQTDDPSGDAPVSEETPATEDTPIEANAATKEAPEAEETADEPQPTEDAAVEADAPAEDASVVDAPTIEEAPASEEPAVAEPPVVEATPAQEPADDDTSDSADDEVVDKGPDPSRSQEGMDWFVLRVASNKEDYVKDALEKKTQIEGMQHLIGNIMVPTEKSKRLAKGGKARITETKLYPGYIFVEMKLEEGRIPQDVFFLIKETTGVGDFVGTAGRPTPMSVEEVDKMLFDSRKPDEIADVKLEFEKGDHVNIKEGPFEGYEGTVDEIVPEKGLVRVLATIFGRQAPIEIEYWMIEKTE